MIEFIAGAFVGCFVGIVLMALLCMAGEDKKRRGWWTYGVDNTMKCTFCRKRMTKIDGANYCPNCGAKMDGKGVV